MPSSDGARRITARILGRLAIMMRRLRARSLETGRDVGPCAVIQGLLLHDYNYNSCECEMGIHDAEVETGKDASRYEPGTREGPRWDTCQDEG